MSYDTLIDCGRELDNDIKSGLIEEMDLTPSGRTKLQLWRESPKFKIAQLTDSQLADASVLKGLGGQWDDALIREEQEYRAANKRLSVTELLLEDEDE